MNRECGPEKCVIDGIRREGQWHMIDYHSYLGEATIHLGQNPDEELQCVNP